MDLFNSSEAPEAATNVTPGVFPFYGPVKDYLWEDATFVVLFSVHFVVVVVGVIGSILTLVTLSSYRQWMGMELMLMFLAVADLGILVCTCFWMSCYYTHWGRDHLGLVTYIITYLAYLNFQAISIYAVIYLSLERHIAICRPFYAKHFCTTGRAKLGMMWITGGTVIYYLFKDIQYIYGQMHWMTNPHYSSAVHVFRVYLDPLVLFFIPLPLLFILNVKLMHAIAQSLRSGFIRSQVLQKTLGPALNVAAVVGLFIITQTPNLTIFLIFMFTKFKGTPAIEQDRIIFSRNIGISLNSSMNFIIYCWLSKKFRKCLRQKFFFSKKSQDDLMDSTAMTNISMRSTRLLQSERRQNHNI